MDREAPMNSLGSGAHRRVFLHGPGPEDPAEKRGARDKSCRVVVRALVVAAVSAVVSLRDGPRPSGRGDDGGEAWTVLVTPRY